MSDYDWLIPLLMVVTAFVAWMVVAGVVLAT